jgi:hypothetical protein
MLLIGLALWYWGPRGYKQIHDMGLSTVMKEKDHPETRFFAIEHIAMMVIAIILLHIGKAQGRKAISDRAKHRRTLIFYLLALLVIVVSIPWPFREMFKSISHWY